MNRRQRFRSNKKPSRPLGMEFLEHRIVMDAQLGGGHHHTPVAIEEPLPNGPIQLQQIQSEEELRQILLDNATGQWESLFGNENSEVEPPFRELGPELQTVAQHGMHHAGQRLSLSKPFLDIVASDEHVLVETDGNHLFIISDDNRLTVLDIQDPTAMKSVARMGLEGSARELHLLGDQLVVVATEAHRPHAAESAFGPSMSSIFPFWDPRIIITVYDVAAPDQPEFVSRTMIEGTVIESSSDEDSLLLVMASGIHAPFPEMHCDSDDAAEEATIDFDGQLIIDGGFANRIEWPDVANCGYESKEGYVARVSESILDQSLPVTFTEYSDAPTTRGFVVSADDIYWDGSPFGQLVSTITFEVNAGITGSAGILTTYASQAHISADHVYVSTAEAGENGDLNSSQIHQFSIAEGVTLEASVRLVGQVSHSFAMDHFDGHLRVATSVGFGQESSQNIFVLDAESLDIVGSLTGIASGEYLGGTRFIGEQAFLLSLLPRQDDTSINLSDPTKPVVAGKIDLSVPSSALYAVDGGFVLDVGRNLDPSDGFDRQPVISLVDVRDLSSPELVDREQISVERAGWRTQLAGRNAVNYYPERGILTVAFKDFEFREIFHDALDNAASFGRLADSLDLNFDQFSELANKLPDSLKEVVQQLPELPSREKIEEIVDGLPDEARDLLEQTVNRLPSRWKSLAQKFLGEGEAGARWRAQENSGLSVFAINTTDENAIQLLATISHETSIRHSLIIGNVLFAISGDTVTAHDLSQPEQKLGEYYFGRLAFDDTHVVTVEHGTTVLDVLANDRVPDTAKIAHVGETTLGGTVEISEDGRSLVYTPPAEIHDAGQAAGATDWPINYDSFEYNVILADGTRGQATVNIHLVHEQPGSRMARLAVEDLARRLEIPPEEIEILRVEPRRWRDASLGVHPPETVCAQVIVPGYIVWLAAQGNRYRYHTDTESRVILVDRSERDPNEDPNSKLVVPDEFRVERDGVESKLDVLANDFPGVVFIRPPQITAVSETRAGGTVRIGDDGLLLYYTPPANFLGRDSFRYTVDHGPSARVVVHVVREENVLEQLGDNPGDMLAVQLEITDEAGNRIRTAEIGQTFFVNVFVDDLRREAKGVFGAYLDLAFDQVLAQVSGDIQFNDTYPNGKSGVVIDWLVDELGAFTASIPMLGDAQQLLARIPFEAIAEGLFTLRSSPADERPAHEMSLFGLNHAIASDNVRFGNASLEIVNGYHNDTDAADVNGDTKVTPLDALNVINVINESGAGELRAKMRDYLKREINTAAKAARMFWDVNKDRFITALDPLIVINRLNSDALKLAEQAQLQAARIAAHDAGENGRGTTGPLPSDLGQGSPSDEQHGINGRRDQGLSHHVEHEVHDPQQNRFERPHLLNGRREGESSINSFSDILEDLCQPHGSESDVDEFFARLSI